MDLNKVSQNQNLFRYLRQQRENKRFMDSLEIAISFFVVAFFGFAAIKPTVSAITTIVTDNKVKEKAIKDMKTKINNIVIAQDNLASIQDQIDVVNSSFPSRSNFGEAVDQIEGTGAITATNLSTIGLNLNGDQGNVKNSKYSQYLVSIGGSDSFAKIVDFVEKFSQNRRIFEIDSITLTKPDFADQTDQSLKPSPGTVLFSVTTNFLIDKKNDKK